MVLPQFLKMAKPLHSAPMSNVNILCDELPDYVVLFGEKYPVHTDFRRWMKVSCILEEENLKKPEVVAKILKLCYKEKLPPNHISALLGIMSFLNRGTDLSVSHKTESEKLYSFCDDASIIYSSFYIRYGIDLTKEEMHWYKFLALFETLTDDNPFKTVLKIRTTDEREIKDQKAKKQLMKLKQKYAIRKTKEVDVAKTIEDLF